MPALIALPHKPSHFDQQRLASANFLARHETRRRVRPGQSGGGHQAKLNRSSIAVRQTKTQAVADTNRPTTTKAGRIDFLRSTALENSWSALPSPRRDRTQDRRSAARHARASEPEDVTAWRTCSGWSAAWCGGVSL